MKRIQLGSHLVYGDDGRYRDGYKASAELKLGLEYSVIRKARARASISDMETQWRESSSWELLFPLENYLIRQRSFLSHGAQKYTVIYGILNVKKNVLNERLNKRCRVNSTELLSLFWRLTMPLRKRVKSCSTIIRVRRDIVTNNFGRRNRKLNL